MAIKWTDKLIESELKVCMSVLQINRMPTAAELRSIGRNDLHCKVSRTKKYSGWARKLGVELKSSETAKGNVYEAHVVEKIKRVSNHLFVKEMSTRHPYDILVNDCVKIDVKVGGAHRHFGSRAHTFRISKKYATCDIYVCVALDEQEGIENYFIIPSARLQLTTLSIGAESKYNKYKDQWNFINKFVNGYERAMTL